MQTKGPWAYNIFEEYPEERGGYFVYAPGTKSCIAKLNTRGAYSDYDPDKSEAHDNARLVAAAPDLLDACKAALSAIESIRKVASDTEGDMIGEAHEALRRAIAVATGITRMRSIKQRNGPSE